jgi:hypothetical protein
MKDPVVIVPSKNRATQLDGLLCSYRKHCGPSAPAPIVLFKTTTDQHAAQYVQLATEHPDVHWLVETDFGPQWVELLSGATNALLLVDDSMFIRPVDLEQAQALIVDPRMIGASLRLGRNATTCYPMGGQPQETPKLNDGPGGWHCFDWVACAKEDAAFVSGGLPMRWFDWAYPFDVSSTLFRTETILKALDGKQPPNPNVLEATLAETAPRFVEESPFLACLDRSACFAVPWNRTQDEFRNRCGGQLHTSIDWLAKRFGEGYRLDVDAYAAMAKKPEWPSGCHMEVELKLRKP